MSPGRRLPRANPELDAQVTARIPRWVRTASGWLCVLSMGTLVVVQLVNDVEQIDATKLTERLDTGKLTALELLSAWALLGVAVPALRRRVTR